MYLLVCLYVQAFIHPSLARIFWSSRSDPGPFVWSPYETCNGTFTATIDHRFTSIMREDLGVEYVFFDFAGSGLVHVCGKLSSCLTMFFMLIVSILQNWMPIYPPYIVLLVQFSTSSNS